MSLSVTKLNEIFHFLKDSFFQTSNRGNRKFSKKTESFNERNIPLRLVTERLMTILCQT